MKPYFGLRGTPLNVATILLVVCPAFLCYGYNQAVAGGLLTLESFVDAFPQLDTIHTTGAQQHFNSNIQGTVIALYTIGGMFGSLSCIMLGDILGRRRAIFLSSGVSIIGAVLMASSFSLIQFIIARLILGLGTGGYVATVPVWQSELSQPKHRGAHVVTDGLFIGAGITLSLWIDFGCYFIEGDSVAWRFPLAFQIVLSLLVMAFLFTLPESPRWLVKTDQVEKARHILAALSDVDADSAVVTNDIEGIQVSLALSGSGSWGDMFRMTEQRLFHRTMLAVGVQMFQQICGINLITFYATTIFQQYLGMDSTKSRILAASMSLMQILGGFLAFFTIDRFGRRNLMLVSSIMMAISLAILAGTTVDVANDRALVAGVIFLFVFNFIFTVGYAGLTFLYATEVAPLQLRAAISGVSTAAVWIFNFLLAEVTPVGFNTIGSRYYIIYAVLNASIVPIVYFFFPETNGRTLEEIDDIFMKSKNVLDPPRVARELPRVSDGGHHIEGVVDDVEIAKGQKAKD